MSEHSLNESASWRRSKWNSRKLGKQGKQGKQDFKNDNIKLQSEIINGNCNIILT